jgi:reactive intermediate/imine deaminase
MEKSYLQPANVPKPAGDYSQGLKVKGGTLVVISGQVPWDADGKLVGPGDLVTQTHQVFKNLENMLAAAGATFKDTIKLTIFLKNREDFAIFKGIRAQYLIPPYPPTTLLVVKDLARDEWLLEVEVMAVIDE